MAMADTINSVDRTPVSTMTVHEKAEVFDHALVHLRALGELEKFLGRRLEFAASDRNVDRMRKLLALGAPANTICKDGDFIIHKLAVRGDRSAAIQVLLDYGANVNVLNPRGLTALELAAMRDDGRPGNARGSVGVIMTLLQNGASVDCTNSMAYTVLHAVAERNKFGAIRALVEAGADINARRIGGRTPLHLALQLRYTESVKVLCDLGAATNMPDNEGDTQIEYAVIAGNQCALVTLLDTGVEAHLLQRALNLAASQGGLAFVKLLLQYGADATGADSKGRTALHEAAHGNKVDAFQLLLEAGADLHAADLDGGRTPLHRAAGNMAVKAVSALLKLGASVNAPDGRGDTPLHRAARVSQQDNSAPMVEFLLRSGADERAVDGEGRTAAEVVHLDVTHDNVMLPSAAHEHVMLDSAAHGASNPSVRALLAKAKVWRRRKTLVMCRDRLIKAQANLPAPSLEEPNLPERGLPERDPPERDAVSRPAKLTRVEGGGSDAAGGDDGGGAAGNVGNRGIAFQEAEEGASGAGDDDVECVVKRVVGVQELGIFQNLLKFL